MINELSNTIILRLQKNGVIQEKFEIYKYSFELLISSLIGISLILLIGFLSNTFLIRSYFLYVSYFFANVLVGIIQRHICHVVFRL